MRMMGRSEEHGLSRVATLEADLCWCQCAWHVLFVGKDAQSCILEFILVEHGKEFVLACPNSFRVCTVDNIYDCVGVGIIASPVRSYASLST